MVGMGMGVHRLGWGWAGIDMIHGMGMDRIAMMRMGVDRCEWGWAGIGIDRITRIWMG